MDYKAKLIELQDIRRSIADLMTLNEYKGNGIYEMYNQRQCERVQIWFSLQYKSWNAKGLQIILP